MGQTLSAICGETFEELRPATTDILSNGSYKNFYHEAGLSTALLDVVETPVLFQPEGNKQIDDVFCNRIEENRVLFRARGNLDDYCKRIKKIQEVDGKVKEIEKDEAANSYVILTRKQSVKDHNALLPRKDVEKHVLSQEKKHAFYQRREQIEEVVSKDKGIQKDVILLTRKQVIEDATKDKTANNSVISTRKQATKDKTANNSVISIRKQVIEDATKDKTANNSVISTRKQVIEDATKNKAANNSVILTKKQVIEASPKDKAANNSLILTKKQVIEANNSVIWTRKQVIEDSPKDKAANNSVISTRKQIIEASPKDKAANNSVILPRKQVIEASPKDKAANNSVILTNKQVIEDFPKDKSTNNSLIWTRKQVIEDSPKDKAANNSVILTKKQIIEDIPKDKATNNSVISTRKQVIEASPKDKAANNSVILTRKQVIEDIPKEKAANNSVISTRKQNAKDHDALLPLKDVEKQEHFPVGRNENVQKVDSRDDEKHVLSKAKGNQHYLIWKQIEQVDNKDKRIEKNANKDESTNNSVILTMKHSVEDDNALLPKDEEKKHVLSSGRGMYSFRFQQNQQLQEVDCNDEEKHAFFQVTAERGCKDEEQHVFFQSTGKYINKIETPTNKQIFEVYGKYEAMNNNVSVIESLSMKKEIIWLKHYNNGQKILLVGEGDFSFSASLVMAFGSSGSNITATSLDSSDFLRQHYKNSIANIEKLTSNGATVMHRLDATTMSNHPYLRLMKFDRIIYNFPYFGFTKESTKSKIKKQRKLVRGFLSNAKELIKEDGEIHITHKTNGFHLHWDVNGLALLEGLCLVREVDFNLSDYPGYETKYGFGGNNNFDSSQSKTYMWRIVSTGILH